MGSVLLENVTRRFKDVAAVRDLNLEIRDKEFLVLVGPSGCGKSTTMEMIAGLQAPTEGTIKIGGRVVNDVAPRDRDIAMVFQDYALYPHMNVYENMAFGLKLKKMPTAEIKARIDRASEILGLSNLLHRKPAELSGGQRQRVALGRAITRDPQVFLMDEPLSNLDAKLRAIMRAELIKLQRNLSVTTVYVTHDQVEAMTMGDRIAVMKDGLLQQLGTPREVYRRPVNMFVAGFIGTPPMNFLKGTLRRADGLVFDGGALRVAVPEAAWRTLGSCVDRPVVLGIRPENVFEAGSRSEPGLSAPIQAEVDVVEVLGTSTQVYFRSGEQTITGMLDQDTTLAMGQAVQITLQMEKALFFDPETEMAIG